MQKTDQHPKNNWLFILRSSGNFSPLAPAGQPSLCVIPKWPRGCPCWQVSSFARYHRPFQTETETAEQTPCCFSPPFWKKEQLSLATPNSAVSVSAMAKSYTCTYGISVIWLYIPISGYTYFHNWYLFKSHGMSGNCADLFTDLWFLMKRGIFKHHENSSYYSKNEAQGFFFFESVVGFHVKFVVLDMYQLNLMYKQWRPKKTLVMYICKYLCVSLFWTHAQRAQIICSCSWCSPCVNFLC